MLDKVDRRILAILQTDNMITNLELAERAHLSPPTCLRRVRKLRDNKVIVADVCLVDPAAVGDRLFVFVEIVLDRQGESQQAAFESRMLTTPEVAQCYMVSGETDFMLIVQVKDMSDYHRFVRRYLSGDPNIRNFHSLFSINRVKFDTRLDLSEGGARGDIA